MRYHVDTNKKRISLIVWMAVLLFSTIAGFSLSSVIVTGGNAQRFYNGGDVWTISTNRIRYTLSDISYEPNKNEFTIMEDQAYLVLNSMVEKASWKCFEVFMYDMSEDFLNVKFNYYNGKYELIGSETFHLLKGENHIEIAAKDISYIIAEFTDQAEVNFSFDEFRFMTRHSNISRKRLLIFGIAFFAAFFIFIGSFLVWAKKRGWTFDFYAPIDGLQYIYIKFTEAIPESIQKINPEKKHKIRIGLMLLLFLVQTGCNVFGIFLKYRFHKYEILAICILLLCLAIFSIEGKLKYQNWKNPLAISWLLLWCITCISDFVVTKRRPMFSFNGYIMIFLVGFLFFIWNQKEDNKIFWKEICRAIEGTFLLAVLFCLFCRPDSGGTRYIGAYTNPNPFGLYLAIVGCVFLCEFDQYILNGKRKLIHLVVLCSCMSAVLFFIYKTQCTTATMALAVAGSIWILNYFRKKYYRGFRKQFFSVLLLTAILCLPICSGLQWGIRTLPHIFDTTVSFPNDEQYAENNDSWLFAGDIVYADEVETSVGGESLSSNRVVQKFLNSRSLNDVLNGRITLFMTYLRKMNLFGHRSFPNVYGGSSKYAHNGILAYAYVYGVFAVIPYILMHLSFLYYAVLYWKDKKGKEGFAYLPLSIGLVFFLENMMDNVDVPFHWIVWFLFLFMEGMFFNYQTKTGR